MLNSVKSSFSFESDTHVTYSTIHVLSNGRRVADERLVSRFIIVRTEWTCAKLRGNSYFQISTHFTSYNVIMTNIIFSKFGGRLPPLPLFLGLWWDALVTFFYRIWKITWSQACISIGIFFVKHFAVQWLWSGVVAVPFYRVRLFETHCSGFIFLQTALRLLNDRKCDSSEPGIRLTST